jgi:hypothetical protein
VKEAKTLLPRGARVVEAAQNFRGLEQQIVEIERTGFAQGFFVSFVSARASAAGLIEGFGQGFFRRYGVVFGEADALEQLARSFAGIFEANRGERKFERGLLIVGVVDGEVPGQAETGSFASKQTPAEGVKGADRGFAQGMASTFEQGADAVAHLLRGCIGEGNGQNRIR